MTNWIETMGKINSQNDSAFPVIISFADKLNSFARTTLNINGD